MLVINWALLKKGRSITTFPKFHLVIPASGIGSRFGGSLPKQYQLMHNGKTILDNTISRLLQNKNFDKIVIALHSKDIWFENSMFYQHPRINIVVGGISRSLSVKNALDTLSHLTNMDDFACVHDAVRPCIKNSDINKLITEVTTHNIGGLLVSPVTDTLKQINNHIVHKTIDRDNLYHAQTPQIYPINILLKALDNVICNKLAITDDASSIELLPQKSLAIVGDKNNIKITTIDDLKLANLILLSQS